MAAHSTACGAGWAHREPPGRPVPARIACHPNQAAAAANTARQMVPGTGLSCGSSIPAIATPMRACSPSVSSSVSLPRTRDTARRPALQTATMIMSAAKPPVSQAGPLMSASHGAGAPRAPAGVAGGRLVLEPGAGSGRMNVRLPGPGIHGCA